MSIKQKSFQSPLVPDRLWHSESNPVIQAYWKWVAEKAAEIEKKKHNPPPAAPGAEQGELFGETP